MSDWHGGQADFLISHLDAEEHPFSKVVVVLPQGMESPPSLDKLTYQPVAVYHRLQTETNYMDMCTAPVDAKWFMFTNSFHLVAPGIKLSLMNTSDDWLVVPFTPATEEYCLRLPS